MKQLLAFASAVVMVLAVAGPLLAQSAFVGTWKLNPAKASYSSGKPAKEETTTIRIVHGQRQVTTIGTSGDGSPISLKYETPAKGGVGKFLAPALANGWVYDGVSSKMIDDHTNEITYMKDGKEIVHSRAVVSEDGKTMTITVKTKDSKGNPRSGTNVWEKQ